MDSKLLSWNINGSKSRFHEVQLIISELNPIVFSVQETNILAPNPHDLDHEGKLKISPYLKFKGYEGYHSYATAENGVAHGGASIWVRNGVPHLPVENLDTSLQACAVQVHDHRRFTVCSLYLSGSANVSLNDLNNLKSQLPSPFLINGDLNGHNVAWGSTHTDGRGRIIENFINDNNICLMNDGSITYISPVSGNGSVIDLALCHPDLSMDFKFSVADDLRSSDHFPIILEIINTDPPDPIEKWNFNKADWPKFYQTCEEQITLVNIINSEEDDLMDSFTNKLFEISQESIPRSKTSPKRSYPWFNEECRSVIRARKTALRRFHNNPNQTNKLRYKELCAQARRTIRQSKKQSWAEYISKLNSNTPVKKTWDMVRKISGKVQSQPVKFIKSPNGDIISSKEGIANKIGETVEKTHLHNTIPQNFKNLKKKWKRKK